jgi:AmmeMemoRadiSam system protein A
MLKKDGVLLLKLARNTLESAFKDIDPDTSGCAHLTMLRGCFVTLHKNNNLRGCIGFPKPVMPLFEQIIAASKAAAFDDPRFEPLNENELKHVSIEISILSEPELLKANNPSEYIDMISIGKDGLIMQSGHNSGLLLPQVATEHVMDANTFLEALSQKAGLEKDAWTNKKTKIYRFSAEVFRE